MQKCDDITRTINCITLINKRVGKKEQFTHLKYQLKMSDFVKVTHAMYVGA